MTDAEKDRLLDALNQLRTNLVHLRKAVDAFADRYSAQCIEAARRKTARPAGTTPPPGSQSPPYIAPELRADRQPESPN